MFTAASKSVSKPWAGIPQCTNFHDLSFAPYLPLWIFIRFLLDAPHMACHPCPAHGTHPKTRGNPAGSTCALLAFPETPYLHLPLPGSRDPPQRSRRFPMQSHRLRVQLPISGRQQGGWVREHGLRLSFRGPAQERAAAIAGTCCRPQHRCEGTPHWESAALHLDAWDGGPSAQGKSTHVPGARSLSTLPFLRSWPLCSVLGRRARGPVVGAHS